MRPEFCASYRSSMKRTWALIVLAIFFGRTYSQLNGTYTINAGFPTSGTNYASFGAAVNALNAGGVSGAVTFNVVAGSGPYVEQVSLDSISGLSSSNTLTINGNGNTLSSTTTSSYKQVLRVNGCPYVTIDSLNIKANSFSDAVGIHILNGSHHNIVRNCTVDLDSVLSSTSVDVVGIAVNGFSFWTNGNGTTDYAIVENNTIYGGPGGVNYGIKMTGGGFPATYSEGHIVRNNTVYDARAYGISIEYSDSSFVQDNEVTRPTMTTGNFGGIAVFSGSSRVVVERNKIHNTHDASANSTDAYGIYVNNATPSLANRNVIKNNLLYNFNGNGEIRALYCFSSNNVDFYHNTVSLDDASATSGNTYGYYQMGALSGISFVNNIISITRGGSGNKFGYYFNGGGPSITADHNVLHLNSTGSGSQNISYWNSTNYQTLTNWQGANSGSFDSSSVDYSPVFVSINNNNYRPSSSFVDNIGQPLSDVPFDIIGIARSTVEPDAGAYETTPPPLDAGVTSFDSLGGICAGSVDVYASVTNFGLDTLTSFTVNWTSNGSVQTPVNVSGASLSNQQSMPVLLGSITLTSSNSFDLTAYTSIPNGVADTINSNDTSKVFNYRSALSGNYTIGTTGDYANLLAAVNDLNERGICGPVLFNVDSASGPYINQLKINAIVGSGPTDTIVFMGNGSEIDIDLTSKDFFMIMLEASSYVTFTDFNLHANGSNSNDGGAIFLTAGAHHNVFDDFFIDLDNLQSTSFKTGVVNLMGDNSAVNVASHNKFLNSTYKSGGVRNGVHIKGSSSISSCYGNVFEGNIIENVYSCGYYLSLTDSTIIRRSDISRVDKLFNWAFVGVRLYLLNENTLIEENRIHNPFDQDMTTTNQAIGVDITSCPASSNNENKVINNLIYNFNNRGLHIGIYNQSSSGMHCYHNTIVLDFTNSNFDTYGINQRIQADNIDVRNNLIYADRGGNGRNYAFNYQTPTSSIISNNNAIYTDTLNSKSFVGRYVTTNYKKLRNWQNAASGIFDQNSGFDDARFSDPANGSFIPFSCKFNNIGDSLGINNDFADSTRSMLFPDPGAYEFDVTFDTVSLGNDTTVCIKDRFTLSASAGLTRYKWSTGGDSIVESIFALDLGYGDSAIIVSAWDSIGCRSEDQLLVTVEDCLPDAIDELTEASLSLYPNPFYENIIIDAEENYIGMIRVFDVSGRNYLTLEFSQDRRGRLELNLSELPKGIYIVEAEVNGQVSRSRIVKN